MSEERFLVTGSEGCIGSWVLKRLVEQGRPCVALDLDPSGRRVRRIAAEEELRLVTFVPGDINKEGLLTHVIQEYRITHLVHLAALQIPFVKADPVLGASVNVVGTIRVLEAARAMRAQVRRLVYASSAAVFDAEGEAGHSATLYGVFKTCNEESARIYAADHGVASIGLRPWAVFGPGRDQGLTAAPTQAMKAAVLGVPYHIPFGGQIDLQYAPDVAETFIAAALSEALESGVYNLRGAVVDAREVVAAIEIARPEARGQLTHGAEPIPICPELDPGPLYDVLADVSRTDFDEAVRKTVAHFARLRDRGELSEREFA